RRPTRQKCHPEAAGFAPQGSQRRMDNSEQIAAGRNPHPPWLASATVSIAKPASSCSLLSAIPSFRLRITDSLYPFSALKAQAMRTLAEYLELAAVAHGHLCAGQVLGVRLAMLGIRELGLDPIADRKRIVTYVEIDRCVTDAVALVANCRLGKRA